MLSGKQAALDGRLTRHRVAVLVVLAVVIAAAALVHWLGARPPAWYPPCWFHQVTGLHCPGCGAARAMHALAQGAILSAADQNVIAVAILPVLVAWAGVTVWRAWKGGRISAALPGGWALAVLIAVVVFTVLRNLPWWPFVVLAPD